ncbi:MAG: pyrimidine-nucleoside phosphorylase, partial [Bacilli bacterium]|nr:pyrimidine-nucleoside phosphorylase [Bacilli bacterium]
MNISNIINKMLNEKLTYEEISFLVMGYVKGSISDDEMTLFIKNIYDNGLSIEELFYLTDIMIKSGSVLDFSDINKSI